MFHLRTIRLAVIFLAACLVALPSLQAPAADKTKSPETIRIGIMNSMLQDIPKALADRMLKPFQNLVEAQTGLRSQVLAADEADLLGRNIVEKEIHIGVFHGIEFAWARQKYPELKPLVVARSEQRQLRACLVVRQESDVANLGDLQGKSLARPCQGREHCRLLVDRHCHQCGLALKAYFSQITTPDNQEDALDDVVDNVVQATVVDGRAFDSFRERKPGRWAKLKVVYESEAFPSLVVAHKPKVLDAATLQRIISGLLKANQTRPGAHMLAFIGINGFKAVPSDYETSLATIVKAFPPPSKEIE